MALKLPTPISREDLDKLIKETIKQRETHRTKRKKILKPTGLRLNQYLIAIILGSHAGMRISEIVGLRPEGSKCCHVAVLEVRGKNKKGNTIKLKECSKCHKQYPSGEVIRLAENWDIKPLSQANIKGDRIFISQGKGEKDRYVSRPRLINQKAIKCLPLTISRRSLQKYIEDLGKKVIGERLYFHQLRHTFATEYLKKHSGDLRGLQLLLGHSRIDTTAIYAHIAVDDTIKRSSEVF